MGVCKDGLPKRSSGSGEWWNWWFTNGFAGLPLTVQTKPCDAVYFSKMANWASKMPKQKWPTMTNQPFLTVFHNFSWASGHWPKMYKSHPTPRPSDTHACHPHRWVPLLSNPTYCPGPLNRDLATSPLVNIYKKKHKKMWKITERTILKGKSTISMAMFNSELFKYQRIVMIAIKCSCKIPAAD